MLGREDACVRLARHSPRLIPGIGPKTADRLAALGFHTIGHLQEAPEEQLVERFGTRQGRYLKARANFHDATPVEPVSGPAKSRSTETTFDHDIGELEELERVLRAPGGRARQPTARSATCAGARSPSRSASTTGPR